MSIHAVKGRTTPPTTVSHADRSDVLDGLQSVLDLVGFIPGIGEAADLANAGISAMRGNYLDAALSLVSIIPGVGDAIGKGAKYAIKFADKGVARQALAAMQRVDLASFFNKLAQSPQLAKYLKPLQEALDTLAEKLARIADVPKPQLAMAGGGKIPSSPPRNPVAQMSGTPKGGFKQGDHIFNKSLMKLGLELPTHSVLHSAFQKFQTGLKQIEASGGFKLVANKGSLSADVNSTIFGRRLEDLRNAWSQLNTVLNRATPNAQHRAAAVRWTSDALKALREASFDADALLARLKEVNASDARRIRDQISRTSTELDAVFGDLIRQVERFMPSTSAVGHSMRSR